MNLSDFVKALMFSALVIFGATFASKAIADERDLPVLATVKVGDANGASCSGTVIAPGEVLTAAHCLPYTVDGGIVITSDGKVHMITARRPLGQYDAGVVTAPGVECPCAPLSYVLVTTESVRAIGFPYGEFSDATGSIIAIIYVPEISDYFQGQVDIINNAYSAPGSSGGGLWQLQDGTWVLVGIVVHSFMDGSFGATPLLLLVLLL